MLNIPNGICQLNLVSVMYVTSISDSCSLNFYTNINQVFNVDLIVPHLFD